MGTQVAYAASESDYELLFWATSTNETGIYGLYVRIYPACSVLKEVADCKSCSGMPLALLQMDHSLWLSKALLQLLFKRSQLWRWRESLV
jgi:hypothetical protein